MSEPGAGAPSGQAPSRPERVALIDSLRGFALLGILVVNITYFASGFSGLGLSDPDHGAFASEATVWLITALFETKFYLLFSFLFGYSFTIQLESAGRQGADIVPRFLRRLAGLALIGSLHAVLLFAGDILVTYALLGLVLLALRGISPRSAIVAALCVLIATAAIYALLAVAVALDPTQPQSAAELSAEANRAEAGYSGSSGEVIETRLGELPDAWALLILFQAPSALAAFLVGLAAGKRGVLRDPRRHRGMWRKLAIWGLALGLPGGCLYAWGSVEAASHSEALLLAALSLDVLLAPALSAGLLAGLVLLSLSGRADRAIGALAPPGRMALSNYIGQSLLCALLFTGYGLALVGDLAPWSWLPIAAAIFAGQVAFSAAWLRRHAYGPLEWLLRAFTNLRLPAWRVRLDPKPPATP